MTQLVILQLNCIIILDDLGEEHRNDGNEEEEDDHPVPTGPVLLAHHTDTVGGAQQSLVYILCPVINLIYEIILLSHLSEYVLAHPLLSPDDICQNIKTSLLLIHLILLLLLHLRSPHPHRPLCL